MAEKHTSESVRKWLGYLFPAELPALKELAQSLPDNPTVINIGAGGGTSGLAFMESRPDLTLYTIDTVDESSPFGCLEGERVVMASAGFGKELGKRWHQIHGDSKEAGATWKHGPVDLVFVDGEHSYEGCKADVEAWLPHIKDGGIIAVHDYDKSDIKPAADGYHADGPHPQDWPGIDTAIHELLLGKYDTITQVDSLIAFRVTGAKDAKVQQAVSDDSSTRKPSRDSGRDVAVSQKDNRSAAQHRKRGRVQTNKKA